MSYGEQMAEVRVTAPILYQQEQMRSITHCHLRADQQLHSQSARLHMRPHDPIHPVTIGECQTAQTQPVGFFNQRVRRTGPFYTLRGLR